MENVARINRRQFLKSIGTGVLAMGLAPGLLSAAGRNVAPAPAGNPLFTGAIGRYDGVTIFEPTEVQAAILEAFNKGSGAVMYKGRGVQWIPMQKMIRPRKGFRQQGRG